MARPVVILAFANDKQAELPCLQEEADKLSNLFHQLQDRNLIDLRFYPNASIETLYRDLKIYRSRVAIFHYAGHADSGSLDLGDSSLKLSSISNLIVRKWKPTLVFLNGCSTFGMAEKMIEQGVYGVIATERPVSDQKAKNFSINFYEGLLSGQSVVRSFKDATEFYLADGSEETNIRHPMGRNFNIPKPNAASGVQDTEAPWQLFLGKSKRRFEIKRFFHNELVRPGRLATLRTASVVLTLVLGLFVAAVKLPNDSKISGPGRERLPNCFPCDQDDTVKKVVDLQQSFDFEFVDQTGEILRFNPQGQFKLKVGENDHAIQRDWRVSADLHVGSDFQPPAIHLMKGDKTYATYKPDSIPLSNRKIRITANRIILRYYLKDLEEEGVRPPDHFYLYSVDKKDSIEVTLPKNLQHNQRDTILVPVSFTEESNTVVPISISKPYSLFVESCLIHKKDENQEQICRIRIQLKP